MCLSLYALLLRMLVIDLHAKNQHNICKGIEKSLENCLIAEIYQALSNSAKNQCGATKLQLDL